MVFNIHHIHIWFCGQTKNMWFLSLSAIPIDYAVRLRIRGFKSFHDTNHLRGQTKNMWLLNTNHLRGQTKNMWLLNFSTIPISSAAKQRICGFSTRNMWFLNLSTLPISSVAKQRICGFYAKNMWFYAKNMWSKNRANP